MTTKGSVLGGSLLVAGTSIGGGVLALPVLTGTAGFFPSLCIFFLCWLFMASMGLLFMELCLWLKQDINIVSMAEKTLGAWGKSVAWVLYLFLFYCLTIAYLDGCGDLIVQLFQEHLWEWQGILLFLVLFGPFIYLGVRVVGPINEWFMLGLGICYVLFIVIGLPHMRWEYLLQQEWSIAPLTLPIAFVSFAYQGIIPTLARYLQYDAKHIRRSILLGSFLPFVAYALWQGVVLGIVPAQGEGGLQETLSLGKNATYPLKHWIPHRHVYVVGQFFAFFALVTSFFGVTLGMRDFLADGLHIRKTPLGRLLLCFLIFVPSAAIAIGYPRLFLQALSLAGGYGCALLLGLLPILMVWSARYRLRIPHQEGALPGGRPLLGLFIAFVLVEVVLETRHLLSG